MIKSYSYTGAKAYVLSFTNSGELLSARVANTLNSSGIASETSTCRVTNLKEYMHDIFQNGNILIFIGAVGIAVRAIAPHIKNKTTDPAVIVIDEAARFVIPILSGHIGHANRIANKISALIGAIPIITTATDTNDVFAFDSFAVDNGYAIVNTENIKYISGTMLDGKHVGLYSDFDIEGDIPPLVHLLGASNDEEEKLPEDNPVQGVYISLDIEKQPFDHTLILVPKCFHIGVGSRRNALFESVEELFIDALDDLSLPICAVASISSIDVKKDEPAILTLAEKYNIRFITYSAAELESVATHFTQSEFVHKTVGTGNVCEAAAFISSKHGEIVLPKRTKNGFTISVAQESWRVSFGISNGRTRS